MTMKYFDKMVLAAAIAVVAVSQTQAQNVINGKLDAWDDVNLVDAFYGTALSVQNTDTSFGNMNADPDTIYTSGGGNELDQVFATVEGDRLHVLVAGNMNTDFSKLNVFFDTAPGGVNQLNGNDLPKGVDSFCCGGLDQDGALQRMNGLRFDSGFDADHLVLITQGTEGGKLNPPIDFWGLSAHYANLRNGAGGETSGLGFQLAPQGLPHTLRENAPAGTDMLSEDPFVPIPLLDGPTSDFVSTDSLPSLVQGGLIDRPYVLAPGPGMALDDSGAGSIAPELPFALDVDPANPGNSFQHRRFNNIVDLQVGFDNSNIEGVDGGSGMTAGNPEEVTTGIEFSIPLSEIGVATEAGTEIKMLLFINGTVHDFASNQFSGVGILQGNLAGFGYSDTAAGDYNGDGFVAAGDLSLVLSNWGADASMTGVPEGWINEQPTGLIGAEQLSGVLSNWGSSSTPNIDLSTIDGNQFVTIPLGAAVPEPAAGLLVLLGFGALAMRRR